jgi:uncharacterized protein (TIGR03437 family)
MAIRVSTPIRWCSAPAFGANIGGGTADGTSLTIVDSTGKSVAETLLGVFPTQLNFQVPQGVAPGAAQMTVTVGDGTKSTSTVQIAANAPGLFALNGGGIAAADVYRVSGGLQTLE